MTRNRWLLFSLGHLSLPTLIATTVANSPSLWPLLIVIGLTAIWALVLIKLTKGTSAERCFRRNPYQFMAVDLILLALLLFLPDWGSFPPFWFSLIVLMLYAVEFGFRSSLLFGGGAFTLVAVYLLSEGYSAVQLASSLYPFVFVAFLIIVTIGKVTDKLHRLAYYDPLTSLPNREYMKESFREAIAHASASHGKAAVLFFDLDHFKNVNDTLGHDAGDELLRQAALRLKQRLPQHVELGRLGGDEFAAVVDSYSHLDDVQNIAELIIELFQEPFLISGLPINVTSSIGISLYPQDTRSAAELMKYADAAMYSAKRYRNYYEFFRLSDAGRLEERLFLEADLAAALSREEFELYYQPQIKNGAIIGFEALLRWNHPTRGVIPPASFIPLAEQRGHILAIGNWVLLKACRDFREMLAEGHDLGHIAVNISVTQFYQPHFTRNIEDVLLETGLEPRYLQLEITESLAMKNVSYFIETLNDLHELGIRISIDDFGTGYSSFNYLSQFPIDALKIDRSFIWNMDKGDKHISIVGGIIQLATALQLDVVAEGVETAEQGRLLQDLGCSVAQGYLFSRPVPLRQAKELLDGSAKAAMHPLRQAVSPA